MSETVKFIFEGVGVVCMLGMFFMFMFFLAVGLWGKEGYKKDKKEREDIMMWKGDR